MDIRYLVFEEIGEGLTTLFPEGGTWEKENPNAFCKGIGFLFSSHLQKRAFDAARK